MIPNPQLIPSPTPDPIPDFIKQNWTTLQRATKHGDVAVIQTKNAKTLEYAYLICIVQTNEDNTKTIMPIAEMIQTDAHQTYLDPTNPLAK